MSREAEEQKGSMRKHPAHLSRAVCLPVSPSAALSDSPSRAKCTDLIGNIIFAWTTRMICSSQHGTLAPFCLRPCAPQSDSSGGEG